ncbi:hypothetical protein AB6A40_003112 [Gnathostoma spinigerum]|uniref:DNA polymerase delta small subunit n=1 Tax=Gnathostoma spinigerum TaxID=75299 RepID=A0ABD6E8K5_9BILA
MCTAVREKLAFQDLSGKYLINSDTIDDECFQRQFFHMYRARLNALRPRILAVANNKFGIKTTGVVEGKENHGKKMRFVIGTVEKRVKLRPSILRSLAENQIILPEPYDGNSLVSEDDYLELEDDKQVMRIIGSISADDVSTGCVVGLLGMQTDDDKLDVKTIIWPKMAIQPPFPSLNFDKFILFVSGLSFRGEAAKDWKKLLCLDLMQRWLCGQVPVCDKERAVLTNLGRLIIAGESIAITEEAREFSTAARYLIRNEECPNVECAAFMDSFISKISGSLTVDLMPGLGDPTTHMMPQQPIHRCVFPKASHYGKMLNLVTNPYHFKVEDVHIMGTSGENVSDIKRFCLNRTSIDIMKNIIHWQHLAPTIPDTVDGFPFKDHDPFIIDDTLPHILFAGNQDCLEFSLEKFGENQKVLLLAIPSFSKTMSAALVNLRTLEVVEKSFHIEF